MPVFRYSAKIDADQATRHSRTGRLTIEYTESAFFHRIGILDGILLNYPQSCICGRFLNISPKRPFSGKCDLKNYTAGAGKGQILPEETYGTNQGETAN
jgi:hypothetical protein